MTFARIASAQPTSKILIGSLLALCLSTAQSQAQETSAVDQLYEKFGLKYKRLDSCFWTKPICKTFVVDEVREDSMAEAAGIVPGDVLSDGRARLRAQMQANVTLEDYSKQALKLLSRGVFEMSWRCQYEKAIERKKSARNMYAPKCWDKVEGATPYMLGRELAEAHIGMTFDDQGTVTTVLDPSPASTVGIEVGDRAYDSFGRLGEGRKRTLKIIEYTATTVMQGKSNRNVFDRNGKRIKVTLPALRFGQVISPELAQTKLTAKEKKIFDQLPDIIRPFLTAIYGARFNRADYEKQIFYRIAYRSSIVAFMGENELAQAAKKKLDQIAEKARFGPLLAQYALVKANSVGMCGKPTRTFSFTEKQIQTVTNGYGVTLSRTLLAERNGQFAVDARFASFVKENEQISPKARWAISLQKFIEAAGGCQSPILGQLEDNLLAYQKH